jgi:hypothetical protein
MISMSEKSVADAKTEGVGAKEGVREAAAAALEVMRTANESGVRRVLAAVDALGSSEVEIDRRLDATKKDLAAALAELSGLRAEHEKKPPLDENARVQLAGAFRTIERQRKELEDQKTSGSASETRLRDEMQKMAGEKEAWGIERERLRFAARSADESRESAVREHRLSTQVAESAFQLRLSKAITEEQERNRASNSAAIEKVESLTRKLRDAGEKLTAAEKQRDEWKAVVDNPARSLHPADQGNAGEKSVHDVLKTTVGHFMEIRDVSKIGNGGMLDYQLVSRDGTIDIRIDVKSHASVSCLPPSEVTKFYQDVDAMRPAPSGAILFMRPGFRGEAANLVIRRERRGSVIVYHVANWCVSALVESIIEIIVAHKLAVATADHDLKPFHGAAEVSAAFSELLDLVGYDNEAAKALHGTVKEWYPTRVVKLKIATERAKAAHTANPNALPKAVLDRFEQRIPKQPRGRPPTVAPVSAPAPGAAANIGTAASDSKAEEGKSLHVASAAEFVTLASKKSPQTKRRRMKVPTMTELLQLTSTTKPNANQITSQPMATT